MARVKGFYPEMPSLFEGMAPKPPVGLGRVTFTPGFPTFLHEGNRAGRPEFAVQIGVTAPAAIRAKINLVLHAHEICLGIRMVHTFSHCFISGFRTMVFEAFSKNAKRPVNHQILRITGQLSTSFRGRKK